MIKQTRVNLSRRRYLQSLSSLSLLPWLGGCGIFSDSPLRIASHVWPGYEPMFLARQMGRLPSSVALVETDSATSSMAALRAGEVDGAALTLDETLRLKAEGLSLQVVLVFNVSMGADVVLARPEIASLADLAGKRVGVEESALGALMLAKMLTRAGLAADQIIQQPLTIEQHEQAWRSGAIDALVTFEPVASRLLRDGQAQRLFDSRDIPGTIFDVLAIRDDLSRAKQAALRELLAGYFASVDHLRSNPQDAVHRMALRQQLSPQDLLEAYQGLELPPLIYNRRYLSGQDPRLLEAAAYLLAVMRDSGLITQPVDLTGLTSARYLPAE